MAKNNALQKPVNLSPKLEAVVGKGPLTRAQVTSKVWDHIKANGLQDKTDRRMINPDAKLGAGHRRRPDLDVQDDRAPFPST